MLHPRLRIARHRGIDALLSALLPSGALSPPAVHRSAHARVAMAFAVTGETAAAWRALDAIKPLVADDGLNTRSLFVQASLRAGRYAQSFRAQESLDEFHHAATGGAFSARPVVSDAHDSITDMASTCRLAAADLASGHIERALRACEYVTATVAAQTHPDAFLLRRDAHGALISLWTATASVIHALHAHGGGNGHGIIGEALGLLAALDAPDALETSLHLLRFAERCEQQVQRAPDALELAAGACHLARKSGDKRPLDLASRLVARALGAQGADGRWGVGDESTEDTARCVIALHDLLAATDTAAPTHRVEHAPQGLRVLLCNVPEGRGQDIADRLIEERLAACVNVIPIVLSTYEWKGAVERERESTMVIKTAADRVAAVTARIRELHPYELPEVISLPLMPDEGNPSYLEWVRTQVAPR